MLYAITPEPRPVWNTRSRCLTGSKYEIARLAASRDAEARPLIEATGADELMVAAAIWDHQARVHSFELLAQAMDRMSAAKQP